MAVTYFPFNSIVVDGVPDRPANAENLAAYLAGFFSDGVVMQTDTALQVSPSSGMSVQIHAGMGNINGRTILANAAEIITLDTASASLARIDRVVFRLDEVNRLMEFDVLTGTPASSPTAPALTQGANVYEMCLAEINVPAGASEILASYITDKRTDATLCGVASIPPHMQEVEYGGTGKATHTPNAVFTGNGTNAVKNVATANGALYATSANGAPKFGTLPIAQGGTGKTRAAEALAALGGVSVEKLWENASPTSNFSKQTVNLDLSGYKAILVVFRVSWWNGSAEQIKTGCKSEMIRKGDTGILNSAETTNKSPYYTMSKQRAVTLNNSGVMFANAYMGSVSENGIDNAACIPYIIYGIKGVE